MPFGVCTDGALVRKLSVRRFFLAVCALMQLGWCALPFLVRGCRILVDNCKERFCACHSSRVRIFRYPLVGHNEVFRLCSGNRACSALTLVGFLFGCVRQL
ncbi:hypothetical protein TRVL_08147 [Trypanosoma vivax]|nr:hypothetical protein TRVL_08147 [Trypanosoma vivax]